MKNNNFLVLMIPSLFLFSCSRPVIIDAITEKEAIEFINNKYANATYQQPLFDKTTVNWKINKDDDAQHAAIHIGKYLYDPIGDTKVEGDKGNKVHIEDEARIEAFKTELENLETEPKVLGNIGHEAVCALNPTIYEALYHAQGEYPYSLKYKYVNNNTGIKITSQYQGLDTTYTRIHTYNKDGHETKFELTFINDNLAVNYSLTINFKY